MSKFQLKAPLYACMTDEQPLRFERVTQGIHLSLIEAYQKGRAVGLEAIADLPKCWRSGGSAAKG